MKYKQPRSVQVVIFADAPSGRQYLLLKRVVSHGGFWQPVTGSLEEGETHWQAAVREVREETGICIRADELIDLGVINTFEIAPQWRGKYAPGVTHNEEVCFALRVQRCEVQVDTLEHDACAWEIYERSIEMLYWESNKHTFAAARLLPE
ncbi:MAG: dihydroneopterin triphosphate diphosphatase [Acidobacteriota bacterium]